MINEIKIGTYLQPENWPIGGNLEAGDPSFCDYYLPTNSAGPITQVAVNVKITGRTPIRRAGDLWRRVQVTFPGDGEPDKTTGGWILFYEPSRQR